MRTKIEITSYDAAVFEGEFENLESAEKFWAWWANQAVKGALPQGGAVITSAGTVDNWRAAHPLPFQPLTPAQQEMVERYLLGSLFENADGAHKWDDESCSCGRDCCTCQATGERVCSSLTTWVEGVGNVKISELWRDLSGMRARRAGLRAQFAGRAK